MGSRRALLRTGAILPFAAACAPEVLGRSRAVRIAVSWSGSELSAFQRVLDTVAAGLAVEVIPLGDDIETAFTAGGRSAPDIVMLPRAGRVRELAEQGKLAPVQDYLWYEILGSGKPYPDYWRNLLGYKEKLYGVPFKAADKSLVWYDRDLVEKYRLGDPPSWTLPQWKERMARLSGEPTRLLALAGADGWVLTDLFENLLMAVDPKTYEQLANSKPPREWSRPAVRAALTHFADLCADQRVFPGGIGAALTRDFPAAVHEVFERQAAVLVVAPDFAEPIVWRSLERVGRDKKAIGVARFPAAEAGGRRPQIVGGDVIVVTRDAGAAAAKVVEKLALPQAPAAWIKREGGFLAANLWTEAQYSEDLRRAARMMRERSTDPLNPVDLSDRIGAVGGRNGLWRVLTEFLVAVVHIRPTDSDRIGAAVTDAIAKLTELERQG
ncbi:ABC transporter substrate-binding protein [Nocardia goodfellowii]